MEQALLEVTAGKILDREVLASVVDAVVVDVDDRGIAQRGNRLVLARELLPSVAVPSSGWLIFSATSRCSDSLRASHTLARAERPSWRNMV